MSEKVYPDRVQAPKTRRTAIKKAGSEYYLYRHTSKRVPGKKYPQPADTCIGAITPDGVIKSGKKKLGAITPDGVIKSDKKKLGAITPDGVIKSGKKKPSLTTAEVKACGFSKTLWTLCPQSRKKPLGGDWEDVLAIVLMKWSPNSCISKERPVKKRRIPLSVCCTDGFLKQPDL